MISINDVLVNCKNQDNEHYFDNRTINALNHADIYTVEDLLNYCGTYDTRAILAGIRGLGKIGIHNVQVFLLSLEEAGFSKKSVTGVTPEIYIRIDKNIQASSLMIYSKYLSKRTLNALHSIGIDSVIDLLKMEEGYFLGIKGLGKSGIDEIIYFINYLNKESFVSSKIENQTLGSLVSDERLLNILNYNSIMDMNGLGDLIKNPGRFREIRYLTDNDYEILKGLYHANNSEKITDKNSFNKSFLDLLNSFSKVDKFICDNRLLGHLTLSEIGDSLGITRERVRQKQKNIELTFMENGNLLMTHNPELLAKILGVINSYKFIFLPQDINLFDFLGFTESEYKIAFLSLRGLEGIKGAILDNGLYTLYQSDIDLNQVELNQLLNYINTKLSKNNDDIDIEDFFYETIVDDVFSSNLKQDHQESLIKKKQDLDKDKIPKQKYVSGRNNVYELVID